MLKDNQRKKNCNNELELDEASLKIEITSEGIFQQFYTSELDQIRLREFQNPKYLQEFSLDGTKFKYQNEQFDYAFPLRSQTLHYQPLLKDLIDIEIFNHIKPNPICIAYAKQKIAVAYSDYLQIWNQKKERQFIIQQADVCCLDFSQDSDILICGQNKNIILIDGNKGVVIQQFPNIHQQRIIVLRCIYLQKDNLIITTSIDVSGQSLFILFSKGIFSYSAEEREMLDTMHFPTGAMKQTQIKDNTILLVVNSIEFLWLLKISILSNSETNIELVYEVKNPRKIRDSQIFKTCCSIGRGIVRRAGKLERKYIIIYVWDNKLYHLIIEDDENITKDPKMFSQSKQINIGCQVYECLFIKDSLYMLYTQKGIIMMNTINIDMSCQNIELSQVNHQIFQQSYLQPVGQQLRKCKFMMKKVTQQYVRMKLQNEPIQNYSQQFSNQIGLFNGKCMRGMLLGQNTIIQTLIEKEEWLNCMNFILSLYEGYNEFYSEYLELNLDERYSLIKRNVEDLSLKYIQFCLNLIHINDQLLPQSSKYQQQELKNTNYTLLSILIEFLLKCNSYDLLFVRIMNDVNFALKDNHVLFLYCLQPFYSQRLVKVIPNSILAQIIEIYIQQNRLDLLQMLIQSIDHKRIVSDQLIKICLKHGLMKSLAIICSQGDHESYLTPIFKIWSVILIMIEKEDFDISQYYCCRALALMKMVFGGYDVLSDKMDHRKTKEIQLQLANWILNEQNLERLMTLQTVSTFEVVLQLLEFQKKSDENSFSKTLLMVSKVISLMQAGNNEFQQAYQQHHKQENFLDDLKGFYNLFQIRCFSRFGGHKQRIIQHLNYMLKNIQQFNWIYFSELVKSVQDEQIQVKAMQWQYKKDIIDFLKQQYFINIIIKLEKNADEQDLTEILGLSYEADFTTFSMINVYFAEKKREYVRAFDFYLSSHNRFIKSLVFDWVTLKMKDLQEEDEVNFNQMKTALIQKISDLIQIDWNKTRIIFSNYNSESESEVIDKLSQFPELQLQYIENVIRRERELGHRVEDSLLILNITLLSQINPDKIIEEVSNNEYPLEEVLKPCREQNILSAQAYILERMGKISESVSIHCKRLKQLIQKHKAELDSNYKLSMKLGGGQEEGGKIANLQILFPLGKKKKGVQQEGGLNIMKPFEDAKKIATEEIIEEIQKIIRVCKNDNKIDQSEEKWYTFLDQLIDIRDNLIFDSPSQNFMKDSIFTSQICHIFATIAEISDLNALIYQLQNRYNKLDLGQLKKAFQEIIQNYLFTQHSQSNVQYLLMKDIYEKLYYQINKLKQGLFSQRICYKNRTEQSLDNDCKVTNDDFIIFECKHSYHKKCVMMQQGLAFCNICFKTDQHYSYKIYSINSKIDLQSEENNANEDNEILKQEIENVEQFKNSSSTINSEEVYFIPKVSEQTLEKRKKRSNKLYYWDRKRMENFNIMEETNRDIDYCNSQEEMKKKKQELEETQKRLHKKKGK